MVSLGFGISIFPPSPRKKSEGMRCPCRLDCALLIHTLSLRQIFLVQLQQKQSTTRMLLRQKHLHLRLAQIKLFSLEYWIFTCSDFVRFCTIHCVWQCIRIDIGTSVLPMQPVQCLGLEFGLMNLFATGLEFAFFFAFKICSFIVLQTFLFDVFFPCDAVEPCVGLTFLIHVNGVVCEFRQI